MIMLWASPPCDTFSPAVASNIGRGPGHGFNTRDFADPERGPCCADPTCKYAAQARLHDEFLPFLQKVVATRRSCDGEWDFVFENPRGSLRHRPYMQFSEWPEVGQLSLYLVDLCPFGAQCLKPTDLWSSLPTKPCGSTGSGRCEQRCKSGKISPAIGRYVHNKPLNHYRGSHVDKSKMPVQLIVECIQASPAYRRAVESGRPLHEFWVFDFFAGTCQVNEAAKLLGISCLSLDVRSCPAVDAVRLDF